MERMPGLQRCIEHGQRVGDACQADCAEQGERVLDEAEDEQHPPGDARCAARCMEAGQVEVEACTEDGGQPDGVCSAAGEPWQPATMTALCTD